jgi:phage antirepressor YoqD-like protein
MSNLKSYVYHGSPIQFEMVDGSIMANATLMCKAFNKSPNHWLRTEQTKLYINQVSALLKSNPTDLYIVRNGGGDYGTWIHEKLVIELARWLSPEFAVWCDEKIAELIRNGMVKIPSHLPNFNNPAEAARAWADQYEAYTIAHKQVKVLLPKAEVFDSIANADGLLRMNEAAKLLGTGRTRLMLALRYIKVLMEDNNPYQKYIDRGYFKVKVTCIERGGFSKNYPQTYVTAKGLTWLAEILKDAI